MTSATPGNGNNIVEFPNLQINGIHPVAKGSEAGFQLVAFAGAVKFGESAFFDVYY